jgi:hypothetical protein
MDIAIPRRNISTVTTYLLTTIAAAVIGWAYMADVPDWYAQDVTQLREGAPFVYRILPLFAARVLFLLGVSDTGAVMIVAAVAAVGLLYAVLYLLQTFDTDNPLLAFCVTALTFVVAMNEKRIYDIPAAAMMTYSITLLIRGNLFAYCLLFPLATLTRETTFLLTAFYAVLFFRRLSWQQYIAVFLYQVAAWLVIRAVLVNVFADGGTPFMLPSLYVVLGYAREPLKTSAYLLAFAAVAYLAVRNWWTKPAALLLAFTVMFPPVLLLHLMIGNPYEIRMFAEVFPVIWLLILPLHK